LSTICADTTVICSSDHGDWAGDYGLVEKWPNAFDDDITRVPLIIRTPGGAKGHRVKELTQTFDIFPTIFDLEQIEIGHTQFGVSLKEQLFGASGDSARRVYCEGGYDIHEPHCFEGTKAYAHFMVKDSVYYPKMIQQQEAPESVCRGTMIRNERYKLVIRTNGENELYDMLNDPDELKNLYYMPDMQGLINEMKNEMLLWYIHTSDVVPDPDKK
jgi:choline-sulfatase